MPLPGFGISPFGAPETPYGFGAPGASAAVPSVSVSTMCRYLDPVTRDYQLDSTTGQLRQISRLKQRVLLLFTTTLESADAATSLGYSSPRKGTTTFEAETDARARYALRQLTDIEKSAAIESLVVTRGTGGRYAIDLLLCNLQTGESEHINWTGR